MAAPPTDRIALGSYACDIRSGRVTLSASLRQIAGRPDAEALPFVDFLATIHADDRPNVAAALRPAAGHGPRAALCRFVRPSGDLRWTVLRANAVRADSGEIERMVGLVFDTTASYDSYRDVLGRRDDGPAFRAAFERAPVGLLVIDGRHVQDANAAAGPVLGLARDGILGLAHGGGVLAPLHLDGFLSRRAAGDATHEQVVRLRRPDQPPQYVLVAAAPLPGEPARALVALIDASVRFDADLGASSLEDPWRDVPENTSEGLALLEHGAIVDTNERFAGALGVSADDLRGRPFADLVDPAMADDVRRRLSTDSVEPYFVRVQHQDGRLLPFEVGSRLLTRGARRLRVTSLRDLSERERADRAVEALRQSRTQFRQLAEAHGDGVVLIEDQRVVHANSKFASLVGYALPDVVGRPWSMFSTRDPGPSREGAPPIDDAYLSTAVRRDGTTFPIEVSPRSVEAKGHRYRIVTVRDVTRRERVEQLRRALVAATAGVTGAAFFRAGVKHLAAALEVRWAFLAEYAGVPPDQVVALSVWGGADYGDAFTRPLAGTPCDLVMQCGVQCVSRDVAALFPADVWLAHLGAVGYFAAPLFDGNGRPVGVLAVLDDRPIERTDAAEDTLTVFAARASVELQRLRGEEAIRRLNADLERRVADRTAALEVANRELEAFSYSVSHDLRAPLRHIDGFVGLLRADPASTFGDAGREYVGEIDAAVDRMGTLINTLLDFSRLARAELAAEPVDLGVLAYEVSDELSRESMSRVVHWRIEPIAPVWGDPVLLRQALMNLLGNALKYTRPRDAATIVVGPEPGAPPGVVRWSVRDNGVGFDPRYADKLFGVFQRLHPASRFEGIGIGLANVHRVVTRHGGRIWAEGRVDEGATFFVELPSARTADRAERGSTRP